MAPDFETCEVGTTQRLNLVEAQAERIAELEQALDGIIELDSCLLADAQEIAEKARGGDSETA